MVTLYCTGEGITPQAAEKKKDTSLIVLSISATEYPTAYFMCDMKAWVTVIIVHKVKE